MPFTLFEARAAYIGALQSLAETAKDRARHDHGEAVMCEAIHATVTAVAHAMQALVMVETLDPPHLVLYRLFADDTNHYKERRRVNVEEETETRTQFTRRTP